MAQLNSDGYREREFTRKREGEYLILVVGDSVVYGQGLLQFQRYSNILEAKLNKIRPTRVLNIGKCGTNLYDNFLSSQVFRKKLIPDLVVVGITENDLLVYDSHVNFPPNIPTGGKLFRDVDEDTDYKARILGSFNETSTNSLMLKFLLQKLPRENTVYFFNISAPVDTPLSSALLLLEDKFLRFGFRTLNTANLYESKYKSISIKTRGNEIMSISKKEGHPNYLANQMAAEALSNEITSNSVFGY